tara:strand:- start:1272 stop:1388 length:117 start_codon:yes stop_codon:yes gene_type:complete
MLTDGGNTSSQAIEDPEIPIVAVFSVSTPSISSPIYLF